MGPFAPSDNLVSPRLVDIALREGGCAKAVRDFPPCHHEFKAIGHARIVIATPGQRGETPPRALATSSTARHLAGRHSRSIANGPGNVGVARLQQQRARSVTCLCEKSPR